MKSKNLLSQISDLEVALNSFSFEELTTAEATRLKESFDRFKNDLEGKIWGFEPERIKNNTIDRDRSRSKTSADEKESRLIAKVSHEIRTPLNGIIGFTDLLEEGALNEAQKEQVHAIQAASSFLMEIIDELQEYSKLEASSKEFNEVPFNMQNLINEVVYLCETLIIDKKIAFEVKTDPDIPVNLLGDPSKLSQVLLNLLGNAIKFVEKGSVSLSMRLIGIQNNKCSIEFIIEDTGIGIPQEDLKHIFEAFRQAEQHTFSKYGGAGLGLSIVKQIVDRLGGAISVKSELQKGTQFTIRLDYALGKKQPLKMKTRKKENRQSVDTLNVLVFEDNPLNQYLIKKRLTSWGCTFFVTENALEGLQILENELIDVVFMDLHMPVVDGYEITRRIRAHQQQRISQVPVVALTADFSVKDKEKASKDGINDFILKPYTPEELLDKLIQYGITKPESTDFQGSLKDQEELTPKADELTKLDLTEVLDDCMGEVDMLAELVELYKRNALEFIGKAKLHLQNKDFEQLQFSTHKLKAGLAMMQTGNLLILVQQLHEHCMNDRNYDQMNFLFQQFVTEYPMVEFALDAEVTRLKKEK
ncbi:ATP-binding protein [uncultured Muriicola sp.]|uniref:ATP-binding protein n=1 Tax=uncultured Muriicola sp. TaxID=1583102 RepID=UPI00262022D0|nr:ATP-binding protein [uncultured Muriicola sp.]